tara:strand:- start:1701 stop:3239 length:1539 start_codon:yes stop_codon:yes gene_type:complete
MSDLSSLKPSPVYQTWGWRIAWGCLLFSWFSLLSRVSLWWNEASYYTHGWAVPVLALVLLAHRNSDWKKSPQQIVTGWQIILFGTLLLLPSRILSEPDPFWRLPLWIEMFAHCFATGIFIHQFNHKIPWQNWACVSLYLFTSLPWPAGMESKMIHELTLWVSKFTTESLLLLGYPADLSANTIFVDQQKVTINQACSGIRSFQNLLSMSVFLSIYFRIGLSRAFFLFLLAIGSTLLFNFFRALSLSYVFLALGAEAQTEWHDFIGNTFVTLSMLCLGMIAWLIKPNIHRQAEVETPKTFVEVQKPNPWTFAIIFGLPTLVAYLWFSLLGPKVPNFNWSIEFEEASQPIDEGIRKVLQFDYGEKYEFIYPDNRFIEVIYFGYHQDSAAASLCSRNHPPDYCMGYSGIKLLDSGPAVEFFHQRDPLVFRHYATPQKTLHNLSDLHVFWGSFTLDNRINSFDFKPVTFWEKAMWFLAGKLSFERKVLLITIKGPKSKNEAKKDLLATLDKIIRPV